LGAAIHGLGAMMAGCGRDQRRAFEGGGISSGGTSSLGGNEGGQGGEGAIDGVSFPAFGELGPANEDGVRVPEGYRVRILAVSGVEVPGGRGYV
jgi:hypothetical protein